MSDKLPKLVQTVNEAFTCPKCGRKLGIPNSATVAYYCSDYNCNYEIGYPDMTTEQRYYAKIAREAEEQASKDTVVEYLNRRIWNQ